RAPRKTPAMTYSITPPRRVPMPGRDDPSIGAVGGFDEAPVEGLVELEHLADPAPRPQARLEEQLHPLTAPPVERPGVEGGEQAPPGGVRPGHLQGPGV